MKSILLSLLTVLSASAMAKDLVIETTKTSYLRKEISASQVKGIELTLAKSITREDCNERTIDLTKALVRGGGEGYSDQYFLDASIFMTEMGCPLEKPVTETISSEAVRVKSFTNQYLNGAVRISVVYPKGFELQVKELN